MLPAAHRSCRGQTECTGGSEWRQGKEEEGAKSGMGGVGAGIENEVEALPDSSRGEIPGMGRSRGGNSYPRWDAPSLVPAKMGCWGAERLFPP